MFSHLDPTLGNVDGFLPILAIVVEHLSEPIVLGQGGRHDLVLYLHLPRGHHTKSHCVQSLQHDHKAHGGDSEHNRVGSGCPG